MSLNDPVLTSTHFSDSTNPYVNVSLNPGETQTVTTDGYYTANDGGGATFTVRNRAVGETADGVFILDIAGNNTLVAELNVPNGVVIAEQLGFAGHADRLHLESVDTANDYDDWFDDYAQDSDYADDYNSINLQAAIDHLSVCKIQFTAGKVYPVSFPLNISRSNITFDGNGALLFPTVSNLTDPLFYVTSGTSTRLENIHLKNLCLSQIDPPSEFPCMDIQGVDHISLENVQFLMSYKGVEAADCTDISLRNVRASNCVKLLSAETTTGSTLEDVSFANPFRSSAGTISGLTDAVLSFGAGCQRISVRDVRIVDALCKTAVAAVGTQTSPVAYGTILGVLAESVSNVFYFKHVRNLSVQQIHAAEIDCAVTMEHVSNCMVEESSFRHRAASTDAIVSPAAGMCRNVFFDNCLFESDVWFNVQNRLIDNEPVLGDKIKFEHCMFRAGDLSASPAPARFENSIAEMAFAHCHFYAQALANNGCLFSLGSDADANSHFKFTGCMFTSTAGNVNSPLRVSLNSGENVYLLLAGCALCGFRWTTKLTAEANESTTGTIDPAEDDFPTANEIESAVQNLTALTRFLALHNTYLYNAPLPQGQTDFCRYAETYGVTV